jgi:hypothetical protein
VCDATALPHCGHLFRCGACQRFAALRVRKRIFDVLRFGTPMAGGYESMVFVKNNRDLVETQVVNCELRAVNRESI